MTSHHLTTNNFTEMCQRDDNYSRQNSLGKTSAVTHQPVAAKVREFHPPEEIQADIETEEEILVSSESEGSRDSKYQEKPQFFDNKNIVQGIPNCTGQRVSKITAQY